MPASIVIIGDDWNNYLLAKGLTEIWLMMAAQVPSVFLSSYVTVPLCFIILDRWVNAPRPRYVHSVVLRTLDEGFACLRM